MLLFESYGLHFKIQHGSTKGKKIIIFMSPFEDKSTQTNSYE